MELREFIAKTLLSITQGVEDANKQANRFQLSSKIHSRGTSGEEVFFDVMVEVTQSKESSKDGKGKISVPVLSVGAEGGKSNKVAEGNTAQHKLSFKVFVTEK